MVREMEAMKVGWEREERDLDLWKPCRDFEETHQVEFSKK